eukprot:g37453.t1
MLAVALLSRLVLCSHILAAHGTTSSCTSSQQHCLEPTHPQPLAKSPEVDSSWFSLFRSFYAADGTQAGSQASPSSSIFMTSIFPAPTRVVVINLERESQRLADFRRLARQLGLLDLLLIQPGVDGAQLGEAGLRRYAAEKLGITAELDFKLNERWFGKPAGMFGCSFSHMTALQDFLASKDEFLLLLEDDISPGRGVQDATHALQQVRQLQLEQTRAMDVLWLSFVDVLSAQLLGPGRLKTARCLERHGLDCKIYGTAAIMYSRHAAAWLLAAARTDPSRPIDCIVSEALSMSSLRTRLALPSVFVQDRLKYNSSIRDTTVVVEDTLAKGPWGVTTAEYTQLLDYIHKSVNGGKDEDAPLQHLGTIFAQLLQKQPKELSTLLQHMRGLELRPGQQTSVLEYAGIALRQAHSNAHSCASHVEISDPCDGLLEVVPVDGPVKTQSYVNQCKRMETVEWAPPSPEPQFKTRSRAIDGRLVEVADWSVEAAEWQPAASPREVPEEPPRWGFTQDMHSAAFTIALQEAMESNGKTLEEAAADVDACFSPQFFARFLVPDQALELAGPESESAADTTAVCECPGAASASAAASSSAPSSHCETPLPFSSCSFSPWPGRRAAVLLPAAATALQQSVQTWRAAHLRTQCRVEIMNLVRRADRKEHMQGLMERLGLLQARVVTAYDGKSLGKGGLRAVSRDLKIMSELDLESQTRTTMYAMEETALLFSVMNILTGFLQSKQTTALVLEDDLSLYQNDSHGHREVFKLLSQLSHSPRYDVIWLEHSLVMAAQLQGDERIKTLQAQGADFAVSGTGAMLFSRLGAEKFLQLARLNASLPYNHILNMLVLKHGTVALLADPPLFEQMHRRFGTDKNPSIDKAWLLSAMAARHRQFQTHTHWVPAVRGLSYARDALQLYLEQVRQRPGEELDLDVLGQEVPQLLAAYPALACDSDLMQLTSKSEFPNLKSVATCDYAADAVFVISPRNAMGPLWLPLMSLVAPSLEVIEAYETARTSNLFYTAEGAMPELMFQGDSAELRARILSHRRALQRFLATNYTTLLVLEHELDLIAPLHQLSNHCRSLPPQAEWSSLAGDINSARHSMQMNGSASVWKFTCTQSAHAYFITRSGAAKALSHTLPIFGSMNTMLSQMSYRGGIDGYVAFPPFFRFSKASSMPCELLSDTATGNFPGAEELPIKILSSLKYSSVDTYFHFRALAAESHQPLTLMQSEAWRIKQASLVTFGPSAVRSEAQQLQQHHCKVVGGVAGPASAVGDIEEMLGTKFYQQMSELGLDKVVIYGLRHGDNDAFHTHRFMHAAFFSAIVAMLQHAPRPISVCHFAPTDGPGMTELLTRALIVASPQFMVFQQDPALLLLPASASNVYILHGDVPLHLQALQPMGRVLRWLVWGPSASPPVVDSREFVLRMPWQPDLDECWVPVPTAPTPQHKFFSFCPREMVITMPWATFLLPREIRQRQLELQNELANLKQNEKSESGAAFPVIFLGSVWRENIDKFLGFLQGCAQEGISVTRYGQEQTLDVLNLDHANKLKPFLQNGTFMDLGALDLEENVRVRNVLKQSPFGVALQGDTHLGSGGLQPVSNNPCAKVLLNYSQAVHVAERSQDICRAGLRASTAQKKANGRGLATLLELMEQVALHHTYMSRFTMLLEALLDHT